jgi:hypothetical protein
MLPVADVRPKMTTGRNRGLDENVVNRMMRLSATIGA